MRGLVFPCPKFDEGGEPTEPNSRIVLTDRQIKVETDENYLTKSTAGTMTITGGRILITTATKM